MIASRVNSRADAKSVMTRGDGRNNNNDSNNTVQQLQHAPIDCNHYRPSFISLLEQQDDNGDTRTDKSIPSPRHRLSRRSVQRTVSCSLGPANEPKVPFPSDATVKVTGPESPRRRLTSSSSLQRVASVSVLPVSSSKSPSKGRTRTLVRNPSSKRHLVVKSISNEKATPRVAPRRCNSADGLSDMTSWLKSLSEDDVVDDKTNTETEDRCRLTSVSSWKDSQGW